MGESEKRKKEMRESELVGLLWIALFVICFGLLTITNARKKQRQNR